MLWEVEIAPLGRDGECERVREEFNLLTHSQRGAALVLASTRGFLLEGELDEEAARRLQHELLVDGLVESSKLSPMTDELKRPAITVLLKPGVMDPSAQSVLDAAKDLDVPLLAVRTFRRYYGPSDISAADRDVLYRKVLANDAIEQIVPGRPHADHLSLGKPYVFQLKTLPLRTLDDAGLVKLSKEGQLALNLDEMKTIQAHFQGLNRDATDIELEMIAQTWSEHCSHKTLKGSIDVTEQTANGPKTRQIKNLLKETIFGATVEIRKRLGADDWCVSVFADNAGVVKFDENYHACIKVETHNHPSAIEPYGGANTGLGGVIRDPLGTGLGAKPICNTDVFCFAEPDFDPALLPQGVLHPRRVMKGVVAGVRDYGNRMGIPTVNGAVVFDERYLANPLVFCGTLGIIPVDKVEKQPLPGDYIVAVGGRTGRDGIHGATFSSLELTDASEVESGGAVQIGNAIAEKKVMDVILQARDRGLYTAITDCGAGGFSSAVGEMGADLGAVVQLDKCPLKYAGLSYTEIWISESQERMVLSVPPKRWAELEKLCSSEGVEAAIIGTFEATGTLKLLFQNEHVGELAMHFLHDGRPDVARKAEIALAPENPASLKLDGFNPQEILTKILGCYSVCSKEWIIRQYDHEVQGGSVIKPLVGIKNDGPSDASVIMPVLGSMKGLAVGCGINPRFADIDSYAAAACAIDEAMRNVVAVGGNPSRTAILDNFCWGNCNDPAILGSLVQAADACRDVALAFNTPFVSGKDSLNNEYRSADRRISIPGTLLITAMAQVADVTKCVTMDLKAPGNLLFVVGETKAELGGSHFALVTKQTGGAVPQVNLERAPKIFAALHKAIQEGLVRSCHDCSEGGLAVAIAEMAFAGGIGADVTQMKEVAPGEPDIVKLFGESPTRFVLEVLPGNAAKLKELFADLPLLQIGSTIKEDRLRIADSRGEWIVWAKLGDLKEAWQKPLRW